MFSRYEGMEVGLQPEARCVSPGCPGTGQPSGELAGWCARSPVPPGQGGGGVLPRGPPRMAPAREESGRKWCCLSQLWVESLRALSVEVFADSGHAVCVCDPPCKCAWPLTPQSHGGEGVRPVASHPCKGAYPSTLVLVEGGAEGSTGPGGLRGAFSSFEARWGECVAAAGQLHE